MRAEIRKVYACQLCSDITIAPYRIVAQRLYVCHYHSHATNREGVEPVRGVQVIDTVKIEHA